MAHRADFILFDSPSSSHGGMGHARPTLFQNPRYPELRGMRLRLSDPIPPVNSPCRKTLHREKISKCLVK